MQTTSSTGNEVVHHLVEVLHERLDSLDSIGSIDTVRVEDVRIGVRYSGVVITGGYSGVSHTPLYESPSSECPTFHDAGKMVGKPSLDVVDMAMSKNVLESAVGVATINALSEMVF